MREATADQIAESANQVKQPPATSMYSYDNQQVMAAATWCPLPSTFYYIAQEENMSCGPACVRMALLYLTGTTYAESTIRAGCNYSPSTGTYLADNLRYINSKQSANIYVSKYNASKTIMTDDIYNGIVTYKAPPIVGVLESISFGWAFDIISHSVIVYSVLSDKSSVSLCDPWAGFISSSSPYKYYSKSLSELHYAYSRANVGYMY